jgi:hypothetical protein
MGAHVFQQEAIGLELHRLLQGLVIVISGQKQDTTVQFVLPDLPENLEAGAIREPDIEEQDIRPQAKRCADGLGHSARFADHGNLRIVAQEHPQAGPHHLVVVHQ